MLNRLPPSLRPLLQSLAFKVVAGLLVFYFVFAWLAINPLAKWLLPWVAESQLASQASVEKVTFDPLRLTTTIEKLALTDKHGAPLASFDRLVVDLETSGLFNWAWKLKQITLTAPRVNVHISKQGRLNWADLIAKLNEDPSPPSPDLPRVIIENIAISQGNIDYEDAQHATPLRASLKPLDFELEGFSTLPKDRGDYLIAAKLPYQGATIKWKGNFGVNPLASQGALAIEGLQIAKLMQWVDKASLPLQVEAGTFASQFNYDFSVPNQQPKLLVNDATLHINDLAGALAQGDKLAFAQLAVTAKHLALNQQKQLLITTQNIAVQLDQLSWHKPQADIAIANSSLTLPKLTFTQDKQAQLQFDNLNLNIQQVQLQQAQKTLFTLPELAIENVSLNLADRQANVARILLNKGQLSAAQTAAGLDWQRAFAAPAETITANTDAPAVADEKASEPFHFAIAEIALAHWQLSYADQQFAKPLQATVGDFNLQLAVDNASGLALKDLQLEATQLSLQADKKPAAQLARVAVNNAQLALDQQKVEIAAIQLQGLKTAVIRQADQHLNWQTILTPSASANKNGADKNSTAVASSKPSATSTKPWAYAVKRLALQQAEIHIEDQSTPTPVVLDVLDASVEATDLSQNMARLLPVKAGFKVKQGGQFNLQGKLAAAPFKTELQCTLTDLALKPFAPYIQQAALLQLESGAASLQGKLQQTSNGETRFNGGFSVNQLSILEEGSQQPFLRWEKLQGDGLALSLAPNKLQLSTLTLSKPQSKFIIYPDRSLNITKVMRTTTPAASDAPAAASTPASAPVAASKPTATTASNSNDFPVAIDTVRINNAELEFADLSLPQPFGTHIHTLGGVINGISSNPSATAQVELDGKVDDYGAARIRGALQPFKATEFTDLKVAFTNLEMNRLTPYSGKFAGRRIESGKLSVDLGYKIKQRVLAGENKFVIHKLTLGERVDSKDAPNLPLDLAIAILEDSDGVIDLDLPVSGSLDDPKFSIGGIVWKAFTNVLTKIVTAPFSALGKLFGGSEKLEAIVFDPGNATISPPELEKLHSVSTALAKRQQLKLGIVPGYDVATDTRAIQEASLRKQVAEEVGVRLEPGQAPGPIDLNNPKVQSAIQTLHDKLTNKGLLKRLAAKLEKAPEGFYAQAQETLTTSIQVTDADLQTLAKTRADAIQKALLAAGVSTERVSITVPATVKADRDHVPTKLTLDAIKH
ncbi:DUF748 domain-containing protein [Methylophilus sp. 14]|uniref:DUF748 domain-containing protein n=1 Tax=Methylophilus sp. 14 TaxID=2781019 RepID=UPI00188FAF08|nr:DUF748 domain-containing protein [Methylophilus sp. 14]MBF4987290.1 DUF748 domain-containing protein [Methylophilus sp. 14]